MNEVAEIVINPAVAELSLGDAEPLHRVARDVDAVKLVEITANVLPEVGELQGGARAVGKLLPLRIAIAADVQHKPADGVGAAAAIVEELLEPVVACDALVLFECIN